MISGGLKERGCTSLYRCDSHSPVDSAPNPIEIDVSSAVERLAGLVRRTPVAFPGPGAFGVDRALVLKLECLQHAGSFKVRGSFNTALATELPDSGLIAASGGNHGVAVAHVARSLGIGAEVFVPGVSSAVKVDRIRALGATVHVVGELYDDAQAACDERAAQTHALNIHPYDSPLTVAGQATLGAELLEQLDQIDTVVVAVGGGGLAAGLAAALPSHIRIVCVEPATSRCLSAAIEAGRPVPVDVGGVAADSLGAKSIGNLPWQLLADRVESVVVSDEAIIDARRRLWDDARVVAEHGGATALAGVTSEAIELGADERTVVVVCGSNTDPRDLVD